jgi:hypothetical protein
MGIQFQVMSVWNEDEPTIVNSSFSFLKDKQFQNRVTYWHLNDRCQQF